MSIAAALPGIDPLRPVRIPTPAACCIRVEKTASRPSARHRRHGQDRTSTMTGRQQSYARNWAGMRGGVLLFNRPHPGLE